MSEREQEFCISHIISYIGEGYLVVQERSGSFRVIDQATGNQFFLTPEGGCFWLSGFGTNPFDEDARCCDIWKENILEILRMAGLNPKCAEDKGLK